MLDGYKTYAVALGGIMLAWGSYLTGATTIDVAAQATLTAVLGMTIRRGITTEVAK